MPVERPRDLGHDPKQFIIGQSQGMVARSQLADQAILAKLFFRLIFLPIWLPFKIWGMIKRKRQINAFVLARAENVVVVTDEVVREIALKWVEDHPSDFPLGDYDPKVMKLQRSFKKILDRQS